MADGDVGAGKFRHLTFTACEERMRQSRPSGDFETEEGTVWTCVCGRAFAFVDDEAEGGSWHVLLPTEQRLHELREANGYDPYADSTTLEDLIAYKDALEDRFLTDGEALDQINAILGEDDWDGAAGRLAFICEAVRKVRPAQSRAIREAILDGPYIPH